MKSGREDLDFIASLTQGVDGSVRDVIPQLLIFDGSVYSEFFIIELVKQIVLHPLPDTTTFWQDVLNSL